MMEWVGRLEEIRTKGIRFIEVLHVDGRRFKGEWLGVRETPNGRQMVLRDGSGREVCVYFPAIRQLLY